GSNSKIYKKDCLLANHRFFLTSPRLGDLYIDGKVCDSSIMKTCSNHVDSE
ncbi:21567_t:CDS:1, partial [Dentiscutata erythropus]